MSGLAARRATTKADEAPDYDSTDSGGGGGGKGGEGGDRSDPEGPEVDSDEYGSAEHSGDDGSDASDRESNAEDNRDEDRKADDASQVGKPQAVDHDEDRRNPQYIPKRGTFYEHDDRTAAGAENENVAEISDSVASIELNRIDRNSSIEGSEKGSVTAVSNERRKPQKVTTDRWLHDKYNENDQAPKSSEELMAVYGYDIRGEVGPPKALRRHRYGRGPNKYTRNWEDENAYGKINNPVRLPKQPPSVTNGKDFPALHSKNDRNRPIDKRRKNDKKIRIVESKISPDKNANDKIIHDNKVFINKTLKSDKEVQDKKIGIEDTTPKWKNRAVPPKTELRKPIVGFKTQAPLIEQNKSELSQAPSTPKSLPLMSTTQTQATPPPAIVPLQENKLPSARKLTQSQVPPRMQVSSASAVTASITVTSTTAAVDTGTRGKRYSSIRQRPMPDTYQPHQQQPYIADYQQSIPKQSSAQQTISSLSTIPHQQTPPPLTQHHQPIPQQIHQQTPPPALPQLHQPSSQQLHQQQNSQLLTQNAQIHQQSAQIHQQATQIIQSTPPIHQQNQQILQPSTQIHQTSSQILQPPNAQQIHQTASSQIHQQSTQLHQQSPQMLQQSPQLHQPSTQLHPQTSAIHQQTPPPTQPHHQTPPPSHQTLTRQQPNIPMRQVPRSHQQQMTIHSMTMQQGGLVTSQTYPSPQLMAQNQYIQSPNGTVYGHVVSPVYPPPQAYATPQHQPLPPQAIPPQAIPQPLPPQALPPQPIPPQAIPPQAMTAHTYHHQAPAQQHQYPSHTARSVFREPSGITYYSPQEQKGTAPPTRRPTNAIPIVPPPPKERNKQLDNVPPPTDNIDHIIDNMFVPRQGRTGPARPGETPPRSLEPTVMRTLDDLSRHSEEKIIDEKFSKENSPEVLLPRVESLSNASEPPSLTNLDHSSYAVIVENVYSSPDNFHMAEEVTISNKEEKMQEISCDIQSDFVLPEEKPEDTPKEEENYIEDVDVPYNNSSEAAVEEYYADASSEPILQEIPDDTPPIIEAAPEIQVAPTHLEAVDESEPPSESNEDQQPLQEQQLTETDNPSEEQPKPDPVENE